jgi:DtxR family Mn-dependent transcriptional regulator
MSDTVERRILQILDNPTESPFGNPIPGLEELVPGAKPSAVRGEHWVSLDRAAGDDTVRVTVRRIGESAQVDPEVVALLQRAGVVPGGAVRVQRAATGVLVGSAGEYVELPGEIASQVSVEPIG